MDAASEVVTIPASDSSATITTTIQKTTDTFNVNQSNNNTHIPTITHTGSNSLLSKTTSNVIGNNSSSNSLSIGVGSNSNSSCSSSSTSSNSSGYGSSTTTPTNNYDLQNTTPTTTPVPTTPVPNTEHIIPVATVAAVTPFYNEAITTHNLETQHHHHYAQQSQQLQQQQHHVLPTHHQQYSQNHLQANIQHQQHHQYLPRQQYYSPYEYQQPAPTHNLSAPSATPTVAPYNMIIPGPYEMSSSTIAPAYGASQYKTTNPTVNTTYERSSLVKSNVAATGYTQQPQHQHVEQQQSKTINQHITSILSSSKSRSSSSLISNSTTTNTSKPQAAATPFYANPTPFYDNYKHKIPLEYHDTYSSPSSATAATYHQQQKYYAAAKSQLNEASYGSPGGLNSKSAYANTSNVFPGSTAGLNLSSASYEKYMYPHAPPTGFTATGHFGNETPPDLSNYRKPIMGSNMNSPSWPWGIEYTSGNSRSIPPPASHIPTATVAPTHATHLNQNPSVLARDPFYMTHDKYVGKYDKYSSASYPQTYISPPTNRHMWPNTPHVSNMATLNERHLLPSGPASLPAHGLHTNPYYPNNPNASLNSRQTCCTQPYQSQSCYYPLSHPVPQRLPHSQNPTVAPTPAGGYLSAQQSLGQSPHLNALTASCKYGGVLPDYGNVNKIKNSNDLYINSHHYDNNPPPHNCGYATAHNNQQLYNTNAHQTVAHGAMPTSLLTNNSLNANPTSYTNDLNLTTSSFDNYHTHLGNVPDQQTLTGIHNTQPSTYGPTGVKRALLDYRKPIQPQPPPTLPEDFYPSLTTREHFNQQELLNTPDTTTTFEEYGVHQRNATDLSTENLNDSDLATGESNKNLSLRDFIANWNDDEDEYQNNDEINFDQTAVINEVLQTAPVDQEPATEMVTIQEVKVIKHALQNAKDDKTVEETIKPAEDQSAVLTATEENQCVNLPDIVIDIKKSNTVNNSIATPTTSPTTPTTQAEVTQNSLILTDFDVEKELDELNLKKPQQQEPTKEINAIQDSKNVTTPQLSFDDFNLESTNKTVLSALTTRLATNQSSESYEQYLKDIEGYESSCSRHSNESAFEKEYETFINKITNESSCATKKSKPEIVGSEKDMDFDKNVQDFSKFYKRKRKIKEDEQKVSATANQNNKKLKTSEATKVNNSNFPQVYTKKCRNRLLRIKTEKLYKRKPLSAFYKIIYSLRHQELQRGKRVREFLLELKEKHLPLIKRQSIKNYTPDKNESIFNPKSLKAMCIMVFNTEEFRQSLLMAKEQEQPTSLETEEKHICDDPTCETCEVIKSLMDTENFEATLLQQTTEPSASICAETIKEPIIILEDETNTKDLNIRNEKAIIISNEVADYQYIRENVSDLVTKSVLLENIVLQETNDNFLETEEQNTLTKDPAVISLQTVFDNFTATNLERNFSEDEKLKPECRDVEFLKQALVDTDLSMILEKPDESEDKSTHFDDPFEEDLKQPVDATFFEASLESKSLHEKNTIHCDLSECDQFDTTTAETFPKDNTSQVQNTNVIKGNEEIKALEVNNLSNETFPPQTNNSALLNDKTICKTKDNEESDTQDTGSSDSESESSSSETEDSCKKHCSNNESGADTENDLGEENLSVSSPKHSREEENKQIDIEEVKNEGGNVSEKKGEQDNCYAKRQPIVDTKNKLDNENTQRSPQRIVIRIRKSFSPNEQSLRVENISGNSLKTLIEYEKSDIEKDESSKIEKTEVLTKHQEDLFAEKHLEKQTENLLVENCSKEKKFVTPLKLVLRGKEYLRVRSTKKSLKAQTEHDSSTESESENEATLKKRSKIVKLYKPQKYKEEKYLKRRILKNKEAAESNSDKEITTLKLEPEKLEAPFEKMKEQEESKPNPKKLKTSVSEVKAMSGEMTEICKSTNNTEQERTEDKDLVHLSKICSTSPKSCSRSASVIEKENTELNKKILEEQIEDERFDGSFKNKSNSKPKCKVNSPLQSPDSNALFLNEDVISEEIMQPNYDSSPKQIHSNENSFQDDFIQNIEIEKASSFAVLHEYEENAVAGNLVRTSSLEIIETYSLTDSEDEEIQSSETDIHSLSDSESFNDSEYDNDSLEQIKNFCYSKPIVISDEDSQDVTRGTNNFEACKASEYGHKSWSDEDKKSLKKTVVSKKKILSCLKSSTILKQENVSKVIEPTKHEKSSPNVSSDFSPSSDEESDEEEIILRTNTRNTQEEEMHFLVPSYVNSARNEDSISETSGASIEKIFPKVSVLEHSSKGLNLIEGKVDSLLISNQKESEKDSSSAEEMALQSCDYQNEIEETNDVNILENKQNLKEFEDVLKEHRSTPIKLAIQEDNQNSTPKTLSPANEEQCHTPQDSPIEFVSVNCSEEGAKLCKSELQLSQKKFECKKSCTLLNQSLETDIEDGERENKLKAERSAMDDDIESPSSSSSSLISEEKSFNSQVVFEKSLTQEEHSFGKINPSTKTKAAYKSFDIKNDLQEENLSDSEVESPCSSSQKVVFQANETEADSQTVASATSIEAMDHKNILSPGYESIYLFKETKHFETKSKQSEMLEEVKKSDEFYNSEHIKSPTSICSPAFENLNKLEELKSLESHKDEITVEEASKESEEEEEATSHTSETCIALFEENVSLHNIKDSVLIPNQENITQTATDVSENNENAQAINEATCKTSLQLSKDSNSKDEVEENGKSSITENSCKDVIKKDLPEEITTNIEHNTIETSLKCEATNKGRMEEPSRPIKIFEETITKSAIEEVVTFDNLEISENKNEESILSSENTGLNKLEKEVQKLVDHNLKNQDQAHFEELIEPQKSLMESKEEVFGEIPILRSELDLTSQVKHISEENKQITSEKEIIENEIELAEVKETESEIDLTFRSEKNNVEESAETDLKESSIPSNELGKTSEIQISKEANEDDSAEKVIAKTEITAAVSEQAKEADERDSRESSIVDVLSEDRHISKEESPEESMEPEKRSEKNDFKEISTPIDDLCLAPAKQLDKEESNQESVEEGENVSTTKEIVKEFKERLTLTEVSSLTTGLQDYSKEIYKENNKEEIKAGEEDLSIRKTSNEAKENSLDESPILCNELEVLSEVHLLSKNDNNEVNNKETTGEEGLISITVELEREPEVNDFEENSIQSNEADLTSKVQLIPNKIIKSKMEKEELHDFSASMVQTKGAEEKTFKESSIPSNDLELPLEVKHLDSDEAKIGVEETISTTLKPDSETDYDNLEDNSILGNELHLNSKINQISKEIVKEVSNEETNEEGNVQTPVTANDLNTTIKTKQKESPSQETKGQNLEVDLFDVSCDNSYKGVSEELKRHMEELILELKNLYTAENLQDDQKSAAQTKGVKLLEKMENAESSEKNLEKVDQTVAQHDVLATPKHQTAEDLTHDIQLEKSNKTSKNVNKSCILPDELSADFFGFKNQSSFEDDSEDFHGFEDLEEVTRIRQEIENINDDSAANDGFLNSHNLNREELKTPTTNINDSNASEINELEALEKELSQHQVKIQVTEEDKETEKEYSTKTIKVVSPNDIEHIKQMLESDEELQTVVENKLQIMTHASKDKSVENKNNNLSNDCLSSGISIIPKLSDLCRAALNSSLNSNSILQQQHTETSTIVVERELSVEEALAEMYRQAGVLLSDPEDCDNDIPSSDDTEAHDVLLINLQEILNNDNNDVYVLQCDMNENVLNVVQSNEEHEEERLENDAVNTERVNTVQIILDTQNSEPQIHIISSDSESEVIILSDDDSEINYRTFREREEHVTIPFINDDEINYGEDSLFDISTIHHEEIVPDNLAKFLQEEFYKYLHEKYVQRTISKYYHANRVLKKYKRRFFRRQ